MKRIISFVLAAIAFTLPIFAEDYSRQIDANLPEIQTLAEYDWKVTGDEITDKTLTFIEADDPGFYYSGRIDFSDVKAPRLIWEGTSVSFKFNGTRLGLRFKDSNSALSYYNVIIDDQIILLQMEPYGEYDYFTSMKLKKGEHTCTIFKRNEAGVQDTFLGIDVDAAGYKKASGKISAPEIPSRKIEFYGDSITAGVCVETRGDDSYEADQMVTHNAYTAYPAIAARKLGWELSDLAVGGTGVCISWNEFIISRSWKNLYARTASPQYDFSTGRNPDVVVVNLGQNDYGLSMNRKENFPSDFEEKYLQLLKEIRNQYPDAWIISATGGMSAIQSSRELKSAITSAVKRMDDEKVLMFTFRAWTYNHPRIDTHIKMADQLVKFINDNVIFEDK